MAKWLEGIAALQLQQELQLLADDPARLWSAVEQEIANINAGLGFEALSIQEANA